MVPLAAIQAVPIAVIAWYRLHRYAWYRYSAIVTYQVPVIALHDIDKKNGHPTIKGMRSLADQVLKVIKK